jgi:hypothetical protein
MTITIAYILVGNGLGHKIPELTGVFLLGIQRKGYNLIVQ